MSHIWFIIGTDTDAGKTVASSALLQSFSARHYQVAGYKPVASGSLQTEDGLRNQDALILQHYSSKKLDYHQVNPVTFFHPTSPHIASRLASKPIQPLVLSSGLARLKQKSEVVIIEGAGGWFTPINEQYSLSDWVIAERLPVVMVVGIKLGCINHALLTQQALTSAGVQFSGWIANSVQPDYLYYDDYINTLKRRITAPLLGEIPYIPNLSSYSALGQYIDSSLLLPK
ncbi:dethiobiotin synthase [Limnobaculum parvum]|uniref:ATP-dependent dethiobiotin synthetase BioD n=1 Tax=Limnobaculum parvum TaxID=2172103 RepID=A0A2Y9U2I5_9GAMM|nr:dethiobiotin synthase [Limnobaculum parvum]AWH90132.1 ATP-dependent dethiobiotin synthetase BioD [Limnobaculum parvum]